MLVNINPKLPMRNKELTKAFYIDKMGFQVFGTNDYEGYLMLEKDNIQIHFFEFRDLNPKENYGQVYIRTENIESLYSQFIRDHVPIHPAGKLEYKPWGQIEFSVLDLDNNLLTFGQSA